MIFFVFLLNLFLDDEFILLNFLPKVKHGVFDIVAMVNQFICQGDKGIIGIGHFLTVRALSQEFLTFFQVGLEAIPFVGDFL